MKAFRARSCWLARALSFLGALSSLAALRWLTGGSDVQPQVLSAVLNALHCSSQVSWCIGCQAWSHSRDW